MASRSLGFRRSRPFSNITNSPLVSDMSLPVLQSCVHAGVLTPRDALSNQEGTGHTEHRIISPRCRNVVVTQLQVILSLFQGIVRSFQIEINLCWLGHTYLSLLQARSNIAYHNMSQTSNFSNGMDLIYIEREERGTGSARSPIQVRHKLATDYREIRCCTRLAHSRDRLPAHTQACSGAGSCQCRRSQG